MLKCCYIFFVSQPFNNINRTNPYHNWSEDSKWFSIHVGISSCSSFPKYFFHTYPHINNNLPTCSYKYRWASPCLTQFSIYTIVFPFQLSSSWKTELSRLKTHLLALYYTTHNYWLLLWTRVYGGCSSMYLLLTQSRQCESLPIFLHPVTHCIVGSLLFCCK